MHRRAALGNRVRDVGFYRYRALRRLEEQPRQIEILQLGQRAAPFTRAAQGALDVLVGERAHTALRTVLRDRRGASAQLLDARAVEGGVLEEERGILRRRARLFQDQLVVEQ